jgi:hypothetical protein
LIRARRALSWTDSGELTPELLASLQAARAKWEAVRRSTARADRADAEAGIALAYSAAGLPPPQSMVWCPSPIELARCRREHQRASPASANVKSALVDTVVRSVARSVEHATSRSFRSRVWSEARLTMPSPLSRSVTEAVGSAVRAEERQSAFSWRHNLMHWLRRTKPAHRDLPFEESAFSNHDAAPLGIYEFLHDSAALGRETAPLRGLWLFATSAGWMAPHTDACWICDRPDVLKVDDQGRLHGADGPALRFTDGWSYYSWKGVHVPAWMIEDKPVITVGLVNRERDPVLRRCMIDIMTPAKYIAASDAVCISRDDAGSLWVKTWQHWDTWAAVEVINGTAEPDGTFRHYVLQVPPTMRTAREAVAWTYGLTEQEYARLKMRT